MDSFSHSPPHTTQTMSAITDITNATASCSLAAKPAPKRAKSPPPRAAAPKTALSPPRELAFAADGATDMKKKELAGSMGDFVRPPRPADYARAKQTLARPANPVAEEYITTVRV